MTGRPVAQGRPALAPPRFTMHAEFHGVGGCLSTLVGPGPEPGSQRVYASHIYGGSTLDLIAIDPDTGHTQSFASPLPGEVGAWALVLGGDQQVYLGTLPTAHVLRLDWARGELVDCGQPAPSEQYIWQWALGADGRLYGGTYPSAKLVRFDPATGCGEDLGRLDPDELYARNVAADDAGFVYVGIGMATARLVAFEIATGRHAEVLPPGDRGPGCPQVHRGSDGRVYALLAGQAYRLIGFRAVPIGLGLMSQVPPLTLADGRTVAYDGQRDLTIRGPHPRTVVTCSTDYAGKGQSIHRLGLGPDGQLYGSTTMPIHFFRADPDGADWEELGRPGRGEFNSFLAWRDLLLGAAGASAPLMVYRPERPYDPQPDPSGNPWLLHYPGENEGWQPRAMVAGPDDKVYLGAVAGYGLLGGPLTVWDPATGQVESHPHVVRDQSVISLALLPDGRLVGGTTIFGGGGSHPTQSEAKLFCWDPRRREKLCEVSVGPGLTQVEALAVGPDGLVYAIAGPKLLRFDPATGRIVDSQSHRLGQVIYNSFVTTPTGQLYGLAEAGIFTIAPDSGRARLIAAYPGGITAGVAIKGRRIYFGSGPRVVSYEVG